ncbi:hypothetical protein [Sporosarcina sp. USHLN248]|uniref:hypothetical protein n=1 Tax=Sporosarcina sp. USHLN248 TaxID=3081300 RepID=UPI0030179260
MAFIGASIGGLFTLIGVEISLKHTQAMNYGRFYLHFNKAQIHINRFIRKSRVISEKLGGIERSQLRFMFLEHDIDELKAEIENTIMSLNKEIGKIDFDNFIDNLLDINENAPIEYYQDLNFIIYTMISIYNSLIYDAKYLVHPRPRTIVAGLSISGNSFPHHKQIRLLEKRYKTIKKRMKIK